MKDFIKRNWKLISTYIISFLMFFPALTKFYTNDDFFFLKIARVSTLKAFLNFFNLISDPEKIGVYRPLTLRVYYFLSVEIFHLDPLPLRIISFITFFVTIFLVWRLIKLLTNNKNIAFLSTFLYAVSVTHFGQLYYIGAFQELFLTMVFLASVIFFVKYEMDIKFRLSNLFLSFSLFILAIMSKETAVVLPFILILTHFFLKLTKKVSFTFKSLVLSLIPYFIVLGVYLFLHFRYFGTISGDSYVWNFSVLRAINSLTWYGLWSLNIPEMLIDFVGPGFHLNPNLLKYWSKEIIPVIIFFTLQIIIVFGLIIKNYKKTNWKKWLFVPFSIFWFIVTLLPVLFLPVHKFTYYLTLPLIGVVFLISYLLVNFKSRISILFCIFWLVTSILSLNLTLKTNWITQGENVSERVYQYFNQIDLNSSSKNIVFIDTSNDSALPWSPTTTLKTILSDNHFFEVFYPGFDGKVFYAGLSKTSGIPDRQIVNARQFLGY